MLCNTLRFFFCERNRSLCRLTVWPYPIRSFPLGLGLVLESGSNLGILQLRHFSFSQKDQNHWFQPTRPQQPPSRESIYYIFLQYFLYLLYLTIARFFQIDVVFTLRRHLFLFLLYDIFNKEKEYHKVHERGRTFRSLKTLNRVFPIIQQSKKEKIIFEQKSLFYCVQS